MSDDLEPGVKILKINYKSGYDTVVELDQPPRAIWPKHSPVANDNNLEGDIQLVRPCNIYVICNTRQIC